MADWWGTLGIDGWSLLAVALTLLATWIVARLARAGVGRIVTRVARLSVPVQVGAVRITGYAVWLIGIGISFGFLGASVQPVLAAAVIVAVVLALMLRGVADNFAASLVLQTRRPIDIGDQISSGGFSGEVLEVNGRAVVIRTADGRTVHLPNSEVLGDPLVNHSAHGARRSEVQVRVAATDASALDGVRDAVVDAVDGVEGVHHRESIMARPVARVRDAGGVRETYAVQFWHHPTRGVEVTAGVVDALGNLLDARGLAGAVTSDPPPPAPIQPLEV